MPEPKAQLVDPQGPIDVPGLSVTGVTTATGGFVGQVQGTATGLASTTANLSVGIITATKFQGNTTGNVSGLADGTNINVGIITSTSFTGDLVGNAAGLSTTTANIKAGILSATSFAGNFTGVASGITGTPNIVVGIMTGTLKGDGSGLTGIAATNWIANNVTANTSTTTVDLSDGNVVKFAQSADTTVSFANTGTSNIVTFIRTKSESFSSGGVEFDGTGDYLGTTSSSSDLSMGTGDFTIEMWVKYNSISNDGLFQISTTSGGLATGSSLSLNVVSSGGGAYAVYFNNTQNGTSAPGTCNNKAINTGQWYHLALTRSGTTSRFYVDGVCQVFGSDCTNDSLKSDSTDYNGTYVCIGGYYDTSFLLDGTISNFRIIKGTALYTGLDSFDPPLRELTNITNTKFLACQSTSSTTAATVIPSGTITANGNPTAGAETIQLGSPFETTLTWPSAIKWNGGSAPTLDQSNLSGDDVNVITLLTRDEGVTWYGWETISDSTAVYQWWTTGYNLYGELGQNDRTNRSSPVQIPGAWTSFNKGNASHVDSYAQTSIGAKADGTLWAWGYNNGGQLGLNDIVNRSSPVQIPGTTWSGSYINSGRNTLVVKTDGTLWVWGYNYNGSLGLNSGSGHSGAVSSPTQVPGTTWNMVASGPEQGYGLKTDGTLWSWGYGMYGQLGVNDILSYSSPIQIPGTTWSTVSSGQNNAAAIKTDGTLWAWGQNSQAVLGQNNKTKYSSPAQIPGTTWRSVRITEYVTHATKTDGTFWVWGNNGFGMLGLNNTTAYSSPIQIPGTTWSEQHAVASYSAVAIKTDGTTWGWGNNEYGELGQNATVRVSSPIQIPGKDADFVQSKLFRLNFFIE
jgi:alpha-tubulin suppressor-like RCC1 family protein